MTQATWGLSVVDLADGDRWAVVVAQAADDAQYDALATRLKQAGLKRTREREWNRGLLPLTSCSVTVEDGYLTQLHTGRTRILAFPPPDVTPNWEQAAARGRVMFALVKPNTLPSIGAQPQDEVLHSEHRGLAAAQIAAEAADGRLLAGLASVLDQPAPHPGRR
ncbi:hypothetical protein ACFWXO_13590 [Kitasatospora sp. NPDC059088]|uniref:hypothetical protein n=1 Tax=Kitasatospora sp. NPDC059088 TaxID=3346722 RepID=UPI0036893AFB